MSEPRDVYARSLELHRAKRGKIRMESRVSIETLDDLAAKREAEDAEAIARIGKALDMDEEMAGALIEEGFYNVEDIAYCAPGDLLTIEGFDEDIVEELQARAREAMLNSELEKAAAEAAAGPQTPRRGKGLKGGRPAVMRSADGRKPKTGTALASTAGQSGRDQKIVRRASADARRLFWDRAGASRNLHAAQRGGPSRLPPTGAAQSREGWACRFPDAPNEKGLPGRHP